MAQTLEKLRLLYKVAAEYYLNDLTQQQISERLGLSRIKISRLLKQAREENIVTITLNAQPGMRTQMEVEAEIERRYGLHEVVVVPCEDTASSASVQATLAPAAVECLLRRLTGNEVIGIAMGKTMISVVQALPFIKMPRLKIVQMNGNLGQVMTMEQSAELARQMAAKLSAELYLLNAPGLAADVESARVFKKDPTIASALSLAAHADIAVLSIGRFAPGRLPIPDTLRLSPQEVSLMTNSGAVGDIALRFIDEQGGKVETPLDERIIGLSFEELRRIPCVIAVAGGDEKRQVIRAGLKTGIPKVLITDQNTAAFLIDVA
ncbi:MAG: sugar-binding transcriptional regulator [candidate division KSB1 bacterium]|nr:sugar-binding transcriptional regulator [candidate division KSB1 bacterium]MDZ7345830.1 sugar-binding transcriptional regulator [candidate division KSB1 bacterium]